MSSWVRSVFALQPNLSVVGNLSSKNILKLNGENDSQTPVQQVPRVKEWAYAGIFFDMTGAAASYAFVQDFGIYASNLVVPLFFAGLAMASWALRPQSRTLGQIRMSDLWSPATPDDKC